MKKHILSLEEKFKLLSGKNFWQTEDFDGKLPSVFVADGPHGLRKVDESGNTIPATAYPSLSMLGCSWDKDIVRLVGNSIADDCIENNIDILLAPGVNMKRTPLCGRNFEYFSEDPQLTGELAASYILGVQEKGIGTSLKHFACNNNENYRHFQNSEVDDRTLYEMYLRAFEIALTAKPWTVMCSYNMLNGVYASENKKLLDDILRKEFGFEGVIISDWEAVKNRARALKATLDLEMPYNTNSLSDLQAAYDVGYITDEDVDQSVSRIFNLIQTNESAKTTRSVSFSVEERHKNAVAIAEECIVLLKNEDSILPLEANASIDIVNNDATTRIGGLGSSEVLSAIKPLSLVDALQKHNFVVNEQWIYGIETFGDYQIIPVWAETHETEGADRNSLKIRKIDEENILKIAANNKNIIVIIYAGSAVDVSAWIDKVQAVIYAGFCGEGVNEALVNILTGTISPSGKLAETFPIALSDTPVNTKQEYALGLFYGERFYFGYRYYDKYAVPPQFPFGFGLSYANFTYSDLTIEKLGELDYMVRYTITNNSNIPAKEISQLYVSDLLCTSERPIKELKGFSKDFIPPHQSKTVCLRLNKDAFAYYNPSLQRKYVENGRFSIQIGASSQDIRLKEEITIHQDLFSQYSPTFSRKY